MPIPVASPPPIVECSVVTERRGNAVEIRGAVTTSVSETGRYRLQISKSGPAGSSTLNQSGEYKGEPGSAARVGRAVLSLEPGARLQAYLQVRQGEHTTECRYEGSSDE